MKLRFIGSALFATLMLTAPQSTFAGGQPAVRTPVRSEIQNRAGIALAVQQGKGTGISRNQTGASVSDARSAAAAKTTPAAAHPKWRDSAFTK
jgi:hypothetical protein